MIKLIAALGNPGKEYEKTRHNAAWVMLEAWTKVVPSVPWKEEKRFRAMRSEVVLADKRVWLIEPLTFMNLSGEAIRDFMWFYKIQPEELLVLHDEVAFDVGTMRLSFGNSSGGHNGVESVIQCLGHQRFWRLRLGVGRGGQESGNWNPPSREAAARQGVESGGNRGPGADKLMGKPTLTDWVLGPLGEPAERWLKAEGTLAALEQIVKEGPERTQNSLNR